MKATHVTQTVVVRLKLQPEWPFSDKENEDTRRNALVQALHVLRTEDIPSWYDHQETRFMPDGAVEVEYKNVRDLGEEE